MKKFLFVTAMTVLSMAIAAQAEAGPKSGNIKANNVPHGLNNLQTVKPANLVKTPQSKFVLNNVNKFSNYHLTKGVKFAKGICYTGKHHCHWSLIRYDLRYGCYCYFDPCVLTWYYWCEPDLCYYPVSFCPYRSYCNGIIVSVAVPVGQTCAIILPSGVQYSNGAPMTNGVSAIPEPVAVR